MASFRLRNVELRLGEARARMPFRYGTASLTAMPILHVRADLEAESGARSGGFAADCLPPRWFDKDPARDFRQNIADLLAAIELARQVYLDAGGQMEKASTAHELWSRGYPETLRRAGERSLNRLTASFGSSLLERACIDGACRLAGLSFHQALLRGALGLGAGPEIPPQPLDAIHCRHTVGLADPISASDIPREERLDDGLPQALDEDVETYGLAYFKIKISNQHERDLERLERMALVLARLRGEDFFITLDGNEQYRDADGLLRLIDGLRRTEPGRRLIERLLFFEQPLAREVALLPEARESVQALGRIRPVLIDESDDGLESFSSAAALGYLGCSIKNCKGVFKALRNRALARAWNKQAGREMYFQSGEDLANVGIVPLQQDLATLTSIGIHHAERNGHHYFRGLAHLPEGERRSALEAHADLYEERGGEAFLRIEKGLIHCGSIHRPGYGYSCRIDFESRLPVEAWRFERLGLEPAGPAP